MSSQTKNELMELAEIVKQAVQGILFPQGGDAFCRLHDPALYDGDENAHNCIGCNLNEYAMILQNAIAPRSYYVSKFDLFANFILHAYVIVERVNVFTQLIGISATGFAQTYPHLQQVRKWANFIKHPKAFMLVHDPQYGFVSEANTTDKLVIDYDFVKKYYSGPDLNQQLYTILKNATNVLVVMPDMVSFASGVCYEFHAFVESLLSDKATRDILKDATTVEAFFSSEAVESGEDAAA